MHVSTCASCSMSMLFPACHFAHSPLHPESCQPGPEPLGQPVWALPLGLPLPCSKPDLPGEPGLCQLLVTITSSLLTRALPVQLLQMDSPFSGQVSPSKGALRPFPLVQTQPQQAGVGMDSYQC